MDIKAVLFSGSLVKRIILVLVALGALGGAFWYVNTYIYQSSAANPVVNLSFPTPTTNVNFDTNKEFNIAFSISGQKVRSADIYVEYDSNLVQYYQEYAGASASGFSEVNPASSGNYFKIDTERVIDRGNGKKELLLTIYSTFNDPSNPNWTTNVLGSLKFRAKTTGTATFTVLKDTNKTLIAGLSGGSIVPFDLQAGAITTQAKITAATPVTPTVTITPPQQINTPTATQGPAQPTAVPAITVRSNVTGNIIRNNKAAAPTFPCSGVKGEWCIADNSTGTASITSAGKLRLVGPNLATNTYACWLQRFDVSGNIAPKRYTVTADIARPAAPTSGKIALRVRTAKDANLQEKVINANGSVSYTFDILQSDVNALDEAANIRFCLFDTKFASATNITLNSLSIVQSEIPPQQISTPTASPTSSPTKTQTLTPTKTPTQQPPTATVTSNPATTATLTPTSAPNINCPLRPKGDADCNGTINLADYTCWKQQMISGPKPASCKFTDFDNDSKVDVYDYAIWRIGAGDNVPPPPNPSGPPTPTATPSAPNPGEDLTNFDKYTNSPGPCTGKGPGECRWVSHEIRTQNGQLIESVTAAGKQYYWIDGVPGSTSGTNITDVSRYTQAGATCEGKTGASCDFDTRMFRVVNGNLTESVTGYGKYWVYTFTGTAEPVTVSSGNLSSVARYTASTGPCYQKGNNCSFDTRTLTTSSSGEFVDEFITAYGKIWRYKLSDLTPDAGNNVDLTTIQRYADGPCFQKGPGQCKFDTHSFFIHPDGKREEMVTAYGKRWKWDSGTAAPVVTITPPTVAPTNPNGAPDPGVPLTSIRRYSAGPCSGTAADSCAFESREIRRQGDVYTESVTANGKVYYWVDGVAQSGSGDDTKNIIRFKNPGGVCVGKSPCVFDARSFRVSGNDVVESIIAYGKYWIYTITNGDANNATVFSKELTEEARYASGPCQGKAAGTCEFESRTFSLNSAGEPATEFITAYGKIWQYNLADFSPATSNGVNLTSITRYKNGPCFGKTGANCHFESHTFFKALDGTKHESVTAYGRRWDWDANGNPVPVE